VEYSFSEFYPITVGFKIGVDKFYTTIFASYKPTEEFTNGGFAYGFGIGSIFPIGSSFFFNPELSSLIPLSLSKNN
jgi:hypothetical protein